MIVDMPLPFAVALGMLYAWALLFLFRSKLAIAMLSPGFKYDARYVWPWAVVVTRVVCFFAVVSFPLVFLLPSVFGRIVIK